MKRINFLVLISLLSFIPYCWAAASHSSKEPVELTRETIVPVIEKAPNLKDLLKNLADMGIDHPETFLTQNGENFIHHLGQAKNAKKEVILDFAQYLDDKNVDINALSAPKSSNMAPIIPLARCFFFKNWIFFEWLLNNKKIDVNKDFFNRERKTERESLVPFIFYGLEMLFDKKENLDEYQEYKEHLIKFINSKKHVINFKKAPVDLIKQTGRKIFGLPPFAKIITFGDYDLFKLLLDLYTYEKIDIGLDMSVENGYAGNIVTVILLPIQVPTDTKKRMLNQLIQDHNAFNDPLFNKKSTNTLLIEMFKTKIDQDGVDLRRKTESPIFKHEEFKDLLKFVYEIAISKQQLYPFYREKTDTSKDDVRDSFNQSLLIVNYLLSDDHNDTQITTCIKGVAEEVFKHFPPDSPFSDEPLTKKYRQLIIELFQPLPFLAPVYKTMYGDDALNRLVHRIKEIIERSFPIIDNLELELIRSGSDETLRIKTRLDKEEIKLKSSL